MGQAALVRALVTADLAIKAVSIEEAYAELIGLGIDQRAVRSGLGDIISFIPNCDSKIIPQDTDRDTTGTS